VESFRFIAQSIENCSTKHQKCRAALQTGWAPTRVLDLFPLPNSANIRLIETKGTKEWGPYATLSHCWGAIKPAQLLQTTLNSMLNSIQLEDLPNNFKDAIHIARTSGFRYLWIDSLCIIQDFEEDWLNESVTMDKVYKCSALNIAASDAADSSGGCFHKRDPRLVNHLSFSLQVNGSPIIHWLVEGRTWAHFKWTSPLYNRAWVHQESLLSHRILHCSRRYLIWECRELIATELFPRGVPKQLMSPASSRLKELVDETDRLSAEMDLQNAEITNQFCESWYMLILEYTNSGITNPNDKLVGLAGIAASLQPIFGDYYAGLWKCFLPWGLMWHVQYIYRFPGERPVSYRAPTWSWASVEGSVVLNSLNIGEADGQDGICLPSGQPSNPAVTIVDMQVTTTDSKGIGQVTAAFMDIRGRPIQILLEVESDQVTMKFETPCKPDVTIGTSRGGKHNETQQARIGESGWIQSVIVRLRRKREEWRGNNKRQVRTHNQYSIELYFDDHKSKYNPPPMHLTFLPLYLFPAEHSPSKFAAGLLLESDGKVFRRVGTLRVRGEIFHEKERLLRIV